MPKTSTAALGFHPAPGRRTIELDMSDPHVLQQLLASPELRKTLGGFAAGPVDGVVIRLSDNPAAVRAFHEWRFEVAARWMKEAAIPYITRAERKMLSDHFNVLTLLRLAQIEGELNTGEKHE